MKHFLIIFLVLICYINVVDGDFLWDDADLVYSNQTLKTSDGLRQIWFSPGATLQYYPATFTTFWAGYHLWGLDVFGYHCLNISLHIINVFLLWLLLRTLDFRGAYLTALIFAVHPVHVESVAWISELKNVQSTMFYLLGFLMFIYHHQTKKAGYYAASLGFFIMALLSKTVTATLPAAIILVLWWKKVRIDRAMMLKLVPYFLLGAGIGILTVWLEQHYVGAKEHHFTLTWLDRTLIAARAVWFYVGKLTWPSQLCFIYPLWTILPYSLSSYIYPLGFAAVFLIYFLFRKNLGRGPAVALLFFLVTIFPALSFLNIETMAYTYVCDHYQYLASGGIIALFVAAFLKLFDRLGPPRLSMVFFAAVIVALSVLTWKQGFAYRNKETLYTDVLKKNPACWLAYNNRGNYYMEEGRYDQALEDFSRALEIDPKNYKTYSNRALVYIEKDMLDQALIDLNTAISIKPTYAGLFNNRGLVYLYSKRYAPAKEDFSTALRLNPAYKEPLINRGVIFLHEGKTEQAMDDFRGVLKIDPTNEQAAAFLKQAERKARERR